MMREVFTQPRTEITHSVVFGSAYRDRILSQGRRRGMQFPYWIEVMCKRYFPREFGEDHTALGPHFKYSQIAKLMRNPFLGWRQSAQTRAHGHSKKNPYPANPTSYKPSRAKALNPIMPIPLHPNKSLPSKPYLQNPLHPKTLRDLSPRSKGP